MKAELPKREPEMLAFWETLSLSQRLQEARAGKPSFILHDGPPYANGDIHIGHALNKILKDLIVRYKTMRGFDAPYVPGWDCHGMPIEHQLFKELQLTKHEIAQTAFREQARTYAQRYVGIQREQFKRLGVLGDWDRPYLTMEKDYELTVLRVFRELVQAGYIYRGKKPVYWCASCETALAEAEVEYADRQDMSIYVKFPVVEPPASLAPGLAKAFHDLRRLAVAVWTTTPWTLPANVALCFHPNARYVVLRPSSADHELIVAEALVPSIATALHANAPTIVGIGTGSEFRGMRCRVPFGDRRSVAVTDESVSVAEGTGIVHIAPGHGHEDYLIGQREKLEVLSPVDYQGKFTKDVPSFANQSVFDANPKIVADLKQRGLLLAEQPITHSYPHC
ncbi:MAG: class I tRNA ligase family protein, partial [Candidatus Omnitrophica bacterium]|nr:class I tRNA ligase family protein [Candidatus Omnitrophota bacterium]